MTDEKYYKVELSERLLNDFNAVIEKACLETQEKDGDPFNFALICAFTLSWVLAKQHSFLKIGVPIKYEKVKEMLDSKFNECMASFEEAFKKRFKMDGLH